MYIFTYIQNKKGVKLCIYIYKNYYICNIFIHAYVYIYIHTYLYIYITKRILSNPVQVNVIILPPEVWTFFATRTAQVLLNIFIYASCWYIYEWIYIYIYTCIYKNKLFYEQTTYKYIGLYSFSYARNNFTSVCV